MNGAIDDAARGMTEGSPADGAAFRRCVLARIEAGDAPRRSWRAAFVLSPIAVAAAIVIAAFVARGVQPSVRGPERAAPPQAVRLKPDTTETAGPNRLRQGYGGPPKLGAKAEGPALRAAREPSQPVRRPGPFGPGVSGPAPQLDPFDVASIAVAPLAVGALSPDPIQIERLDAVAPIAVAPLDIIDIQRRDQ